jgi:zinc protease
VQRALPTNYILGYFHGPPADSSDYAALRVAQAILSGQLFAEVRSRRNLTYAVDAPFVERALATGGVYVTTVAPDQTLAVIREELDALQNGQIDRQSLQKLVLQFVTEYFLNNETNAAQAGFLARAQLYSGDYRKAATFVEELRAVTPLDLRTVSRKYMRDFRFAYVGDSTRVSRRMLERF